MRLFAIAPSETLIADVDEKIGDLPQDAQALWHELKAER